MGRKLDALLGRNFKTSKFKTLVKLAVSRIAILKNQHHVRFSQARSDVIELLNLGHHDRALLRVEQVIKEQNMVDAFAMIESYCHLLIERVTLIQKNKECPEELKEATSSLMFASSRCGEFPELLHIRGIVSSTFGRELVASAVELRNNCCVHPKLVQKLSARRPSLESKLKVLKEIASERGITLHLEVEEEKQDLNEKQDESIGNRSANSDDPDEHKDTSMKLRREIDQDESLSESMKARKKYRDVAAAAQEAFESAAHAAAAARAAVELSRGESQDFDSDDENGSSHEKGGVVYDSDASETPEFPRHAASEGIDQHSNKELGFEKIHPIDKNISELEGEDMAKTNNNLELKETVETKEREWIDGALEDMAETNKYLELKETEETKQREWIERALATSSSDSDVKMSAEKEQSLFLLGQNEPWGHELAIDIVNTDQTKEQHQLQWPKPHDDLSSESDVHLGSSTYNEEKNMRQNEEIKEDESKFSYQSPRPKNTQSLNPIQQLHSPHPHGDRQWVSMRTRRARA